MSDLAALSDAISAAYAARCAKHGTQPYHSSHEMLGVITEEYDEVLGAVQDNDPAAIDREVMDVLVVCLHWLAREARG